MDHKASGFVPFGSEARESINLLGITMPCNLGGRDCHKGDFRKPRSARIIID
jgi:hypothetical protein